jgi:hypothetical protein
MKQPRKDWVPVALIVVAVMYFLIALSAGIIE